MLNPTDFVNTKLSSRVIYKCICSCCNATYYGHTYVQLIMVTHFFEKASGNLDIIPLTVKFVKRSKKSFIFDHMILYDQKLALSFLNF